MDKLKRALSGNDQDPENDSSTGIIHSIENATNMNWGTKIRVFAFLFILGFVISLLGTIAGIMHKTLEYVTLYCIGNIVSISSTCVLMGPVNQVKKMFKPTRVVATVLMLTMLFLTLFSALYLQKPKLATLFMFLQFLAMTWYSLSYIPYARDAVKKAVSSVMDV